MIQLDNIDRLKEGYISFLDWVKINQRFSDVDIRNHNDEIIRQIAAENLFYEDEE